jgi:hypothetical protein
MPINRTAVAVKSQPEEAPPIRLVGLPIGPYIPSLQQRKRQERLERAKAAAAAREASGAKAVSPSFDLMAGVDTFLAEFIMEEGEETKVVTFKVPGYVYATFRRVHSALIEKAKEDKDKKGPDVGTMLTSAVYYWLKTLMETPEVQVLIESFRDVETAEGLTPFQESELQELIENRRLPMCDPFGTTPRDLCFRLHPGVDSYVASCVTALRIEKASLVRPCIMKGLSGQPGCNPQAVVGLDAAYTAFIESCASRQAFIAATLKGQLSGTTGVMAKPRNPL